MKNKKEMKWGRVDLKNLNNIENYHDCRAAFYLARDIELAVKKCKKNDNPFNI